jgi:UDP-galactopyranose mutase
MFTGIRSRRDGFEDTKRTAVPFCPALRWQPCSHLDIRPIMQIDYLVIGSGLTGATIARILKDAGCNVLVVERRSHLGGNVHDYSHPSGIKIHSYGPHYFRTSSETIWKFVNQFDNFYPYEAIIQSYVDGQYEGWPVTKKYIQRTIGHDWQPEFEGKPTNFEEASLAIMPRLVYEKFVKGYSEKQWGVPACKLSASLAKRFIVKEDDNPYLKSDKYQGIPSQGYAGFMTRLLRGIPVLMNTDYLKCPDQFCVNKLLVFTGPIDEFFNYDWGSLKYRSQKRKHSYFPNISYKLPCGQVNNPDPQNGAYIRTLEWKYMMDPQYAQHISGTVLTQETPYTPVNSDEYEYPFPDDASQLLYQQYRQRAQQIPNLLICGRLGEYRYYDMDQAISRAMALARRILETT